MTTAYTSLLGLALPVTGELSGTWGDTVNDYITQYLDSSVAGTQTISGSQTAVTLSKTTNASLSQVGSGATGSAQYNIINCTGNPASMLTVTVPAASKTYVVVNATSTNQQVKIVGAGPTTGVTLDAGEKAVIAWNGSDFIKIATSAVDGVSTFSAGTTGFTPSTATSGAVTLGGTLATTNGGTGLTSFTANRVFYASSTSAIGQSANLTFDGTTLTAANFTDSSLTSGRVTYATTGGNLTDSANLLFDGTTLTANALTTTSTVTINGGTANGVAYLNGSKVLTTGSALTFDGTNLGVGTPNPAAFGLFAVNGVSASVNVNATTGSSALRLFEGAGTGRGGITSLNGSDGLAFLQGTTEGMRLTSTGLGIGASSPLFKLDARGASGTGVSYIETSTGNANRIQLGATSGAGYINATAGTGSPVLQFQVADSTKAILDSSGNLGLGVTPSAWGFGGNLELPATNNISFKGSYGNILSNAYYDLTQLRFEYTTNGHAAQYQIGSGGQHIWYTAPSGTAGNPISFSQVMTLDASGNLLVGGTSVYAATMTSYASASRSAGLGLRNSAGTPAGGIFTAAAGSGGGSTDVLVEAAGYLGFWTGATERARITSAGDFIQTANTTAPTLSTNGTVGIQRVSDTQLKILMRGSDGVTRSVTLTLA